MKEYIERAAVKDEILSWAVCINHPELLSKEDTMYCIDSIPAADVVEVVRCGQCRNLYKIINSFNGHVSYRCSNPYGLQGHVLPHFYCVHGFKGGRTDG